MEINFFEQGGVPQPPGNVRIERLVATPYPDGWRVRINLDVTPFQQRPNLEVEVITADGRQVAQLSIIETMHHIMEFTVHLRGLLTPIGDYRCHAALFYESIDVRVDQATIDFSITG